MYIENKLGKVLYKYLFFNHLFQDIQLILAIPNFIPKSNLMKN